MGTFAQDTANEYQLTREQMDEYSIESLRRANAAIESGAFADEVVPVTVSTRKGDVTVEHDEQPGKGRPDKIPQLRPAFAKDGTITAATSSSISDGAAAVVLSRESVAKANGQQPVAKIVAMAAHAQEPAQFTVAPIGAIEKVLDKAGWSADEVELWEVNEAFACVAMFAMRDLGIPHDKINVNGGGTALGHPIGASGTRIIVTLLNALKQQGKNAASPHSASAAAKPLPWQSNSSELEMKMRTLPCHKGWKFRRQGSVHEEIRHRRNLRCPRRLRFERGQEPEAEAANAEAQEFTLDSTAMGNIAGTYEVKLADGSVTMQTINPDWYLCRHDSRRDPHGWRNMACHRRRCDVLRSGRQRSRGMLYRRGAGEMVLSKCSGEDGTVQSSVRKVEAQAMAAPSE